MTSTCAAAPGCSKRRPRDVFTPERLTDEHRLIARTAAEFATRSAARARRARAEGLGARARRSLQAVRRARPARRRTCRRRTAASSSTRSRRSSSAEHMARSASFGATFGAQANLCDPADRAVRHRGPEAARICPAARRGELVGAYALSEAGSGSDALGARDARDAPARRQLRAERREDVDHQRRLRRRRSSSSPRSTASTSPPSSSSARSAASRAARKSTRWACTARRRRALILQDVHGAGGQPARRGRQGPQGRVQRAELRPLQAGRDVPRRLPTARSARRRSYAATRRQFGQPIASFGAIRHKLGEMIARTYALESLVYRTAGLIDARIGGTPTSDGRPALLAALEEFAVEASIAKVAGSETLDFVLDENMQIHGGNGYVRDYPAERHYRDARVNRIFEGTNEINRLLIPGMLVEARASRATSRCSPPPGQSVTNSSGLRHSTQPERGGCAGPGTRAVAAFRKTVLMVARSGRRALRSIARSGAGSTALDGGPRDRDIRGRQRGQTCIRRRCRCCPQPRPRLMPPRVRAGRGDARRSCGPPGAGRDGIGRHAPDPPRSAQTCAEGSAGRHGRAAAPARGRDRGGTRLPVLA